MSASLINADALETLLDQYFVDAETPGALDELSTNTRIAGVSGIEVTDARVESDGLRIVGKGTVDVELEYAGGEARDGAEWDDSFPFGFDVVLSAHLDRIERADRMEFDTSSFSE